MHTYFTISFRQKSNAMSKTCTIQCSKTAHCSYFIISFRQKSNAMSKTCTIQCSKTAHCSYFIISFSQKSNVVYLPPGLCVETGLVEEDTCLLTARYLGDKLIVVAEGDDCTFTRLKCCVEQR